MTVWLIEVTFTSVETMYVEAATADEARELGERLSDRKDAQVDDWDLVVEESSADDVPYPHNIWVDGLWLEPKVLAS